MFFTRSGGLALNVRYRIAHVLPKRLAAIPTDEGADYMSSQKNSHSKSSQSLKRSAAVGSQLASSSQLYEFENDEFYDDDDDSIFTKLGDDVGIDIYDAFGDEELSPHADAVLNFDDIETDIERLFATGGLGWHFEREVDLRAS
jgi:hypothetical protein